MVYPHVSYRGPAYPEALAPTEPGIARELDSRVSDGIQVRLLWHSADGHLSVAVHDSKTGEEFEVTVGNGDSPRDVYLHPYAYAVGSARAGTAEREPARI